MTRVGVWVRMPDGGEAYLDFDLRGRKLEEYRAHPEAWRRRLQEELVCLIDKESGPRHLSAVDPSPI